MVEDLDARSEFPLASVELSCHCPDLREDRLLHVRRRHSTRNGTLGSFAAGRKITGREQKERCQALRRSGSPRERSSRFEALTEPLGGIFVAQEEMLQNLGNTPSSFG